MNKQQTMKQAIVAHGKQLLAIFPRASEQDPDNLCRKLRRLETKVSRASVSHCNGEMGADAWEEVKEASRDALRRLLNPGGVPLYVNSDPRGYALKIPSEYVRRNGLEIHRDWGGYGILAPDLSA